MTKLVFHLIKMSRCPSVIKSFISCLVFRLKSARLFVILTRFIPAAILLQLRQLPVDKEICVCLYVCMHVHVPILYESVSLSSGRVMRRHCPAPDQIGNLDNRICLINFKMLLEHDSTFGNLITAVLSQIRYKQAKSR